MQFDTLSYAENLKSAGVPWEQAKAKAEALTAALNETVSSGLATKDDIRSCRTEIAGVKRELRLMKWLMAIGVASLALLVTMHVIWALRTQLASVSLSATGWGL